MPSTVIRRFQYRPEDRALEITFISGRKYRYLQVPQRIVDDMQSSFSKGEYFNRYIRDRFAFERIDPGLSAQPVKQQPAENRRR